MNLKKSIELSRKLLNEVSHNINQGYNDSILTDDLIIFWINEFKTKLEHDLGLTPISYESVDYNITLNPNQQLYNFPVDVQQITNLVVEKNNQKYYLSQLINEFTKYDINLKGIPQFYTLDYNPGIIKLTPIPIDEGYILKFTGRKSIKDFTLKDIDKELPFDSRFHNAFVYFICASMCETLIDNDNTQLKRAEFYYRKVEEIVRRYKHDIGWKNDSYNSIIFDNSIYNT